MNRIYLEKNKLYVTNDYSKTIYQISSYEVENGLPYMKLNLVPYCIEDYIITKDFSMKHAYLPAYKSSEKLEVETLNVNFMTESIKDCIIENGYEILNKEPVVKLYINDPEEEEIITELGKLGFDLEFSNTKNIFELKSINDTSISYLKTAKHYLNTILMSALKETEDKKLTYVADLPTIFQMIIKKKAEQTYMDTFSFTENINESKLEFIENTMCEKISNIDLLVTMSDISDIVTNSIKNIESQTKKTLSNQR